MWLAYLRAETREGARKHAMERSGMNALVTLVEITPGTGGMRYTRLTLKKATRSVANKNKSAEARVDPQAS